MTYNPNQKWWCRNSDSTVCLLAAHEVQAHIRDLRRDIKIQVSDKSSPWIDASKVGFQIPTSPRRRSTSKVGRPATFKSGKMKPSCYLIPTELKEGLKKLAGKTEKKEVDYVREGIMVILEKYGIQVGELDDGLVPGRGTSSVGSGTV